MFSRFTYFSLANVLLLTHLAWADSIVSDAEQNKPYGKVYHRTNQSLKIPTNYQSNVDNKTRYVDGGPNTSYLKVVIAVDPTQPDTNYFHFEDEDFDREWAGRDSFNFSSIGFYKINDVAELENQIQKFNPILEDLKSELKDEENKFGIFQKDLKIHQLEISIKAVEEYLAQLNDLKVLISSVQKQYRERLPREEDDLAKSKQLKNANQAEKNLSQNQVGFFKNLDKKLDLESSLIIPQNNCK